MSTLGLPSHELAPELVGGVWRLVEPGGESGTSVVWEAVHALTGQRAALKRAKVGVEGAAAALAREGQLLARVRRRWGPTLLDAGSGFLVIEWVDGVALDARLESIATG